VSASAEPDTALFSDLVLALAITFILAAVCIAPFVIAQVLP
jgi:hypothetical protein